MGDNYRRPCDFGDCDGEGIWHLSINATDGRVCFAQVSVCEDCVPRAADYIGGWPQRSREPNFGMVPVAQFDHETREWVPTYGSAS